MRRPEEAFDFPSVRARESVASEKGPGTNRGQKGRVTGFAVGIDWLTATFPLARLEECSVTDLTQVADFIFGGSAMLKVMRPTGRKFQFYDNYCVILDREGELAGRICFGGNNDTMQVELTGTGCHWVQNWSHVHFQLEILCARITHCDVAVDDFAGVAVGIHQLNDAARSGAFAGQGRPPKTRFEDDHGHGTGCSVYVGSRNHKQFCGYEKGKQLKDETSPWVRFEVRFYAKHFGKENEFGELPSRGVPLDILLHPLRFFRGAYEYLADLCERIGLTDATNKLLVVKAKVEATANAMVKWLRTQVGPSLRVIRDALGEDAWEYVDKNVTREGRPSRWKSIGAADQLNQLVRQQLCPVSM
ncbi:replication initiation factor domain-containing protein [Dyella terrae]|uniref:replication initiation factor domain-containing protein n=1 Tax=Dyella terrae TaxID=522259 RepID=UPI001EFCE7D1|nr:replication initiation factor domain-containing protein [Dyella terrae]ULU23796.1 replication initiation factor domain-containing protein [Dyella terrae]